METFCKAWPFPLWGQGCLVAGYRSQAKERKDSAGLDVTDLFSCVLPAAFKRPETIFTVSGRLFFAFLRFVRLSWSHIRNIDGRFPVPLFRFLCSLASGSCRAAAREQKLPGRGSKGESGWRAERFGPERVESRGLPKPAYRKNRREKFTNRLLSLWAKLPRIKFSPFLL